MTTVARTIISVPERSATETWERIVGLIAPDPASPARRELAEVAGVACSCIAEEALAEDALVVHGVGPQLRVYTLYGDDAVEGERANESSLSWIPTEGEWLMSIPCPPDDLAWVQRRLATSSARVTARAVGTAIAAEEAKESARASRDNAALNLDAFFRR